MSGLVRKRFVWVGCLICLAVSGIRAQEPVPLQVQPKKLPTLPTAKLPTEPKTIVIPTSMAKPKEFRLLSAERVAPKLNTVTAYDMAGADFAFHSNQLPKAIHVFSRYLQLSPTAQDAPEVAYKLAAAFTMMNQKEQAKKVWNDLVHDYYESSWAQMALHLHYDKNGLEKMFDSFLNEARQNKDAARAARAYLLLKVYARRFPKELNSHQSKWMYKTALCLELAKTGHQRDSLARAITDPKTDGPHKLNLLHMLCKEKNDWAKLAALRLGDAEDFREGMVELFRMTGVGEENRVLFRTLAEKYRGQLHGEDLARCRLYEAYCLGSTKQQEQADIYREIIKNHPQSDVAPEAMLQLSELAYQKADHGTVLQYYDRLTTTYPSSSQAESARKYATWLKQHDECRNVLTTVLDKLIQRVNTCKELSLAFTVEADIRSMSKKLFGRLAFDGQRISVDARIGEAAFFFAGTDRETVYLLPGQNTLLRSPTKTKIPSAMLNIGLNANKDINLNWNIRTDKQGPSKFSVDPIVAGIQARKFLTSCHCHITKRKRKDNKSEIVLVMERVRPMSSDIETVRAIIVDNNLREVQLTYPQEDKKNLTVKFEDIHLWEEIPNDLFVRPQLPGIRVQDVEEINFFQIYSHVMQLVAELQSEYSAAKRTSQPDK